jgi:circadian clock protein KaiB
MPKRKRSAAEMELEAAAGAAPEGFLLRLYIAGASSRSGHAIKNIQRICEKYLQGQYSLEVVDLYQQPARASEGQVLAAPTLVKEQPQPPRRMVGDMSDEAKVLTGLGLKSVAAGA